MNPQYEFLEFDDAMADDKTLGIATIRAWGKIILKYKLIKTEKGYFAAPAGSVKTGFDTEKGKDKYEPSFMIDSSFESNKIKEFVKDKSADTYLARNKAAQQATLPAEPNLFAHGQQPKTYDKDEVPF